MAEKNEDKKNEHQHSEHHHAKESNLSHNSEHNEHSHDHAHAEHNHAEKQKDKNNLNYWKIATLCLVALLVVSIFTNGLYGAKLFNLGGGLSQKDAETKALNFVNNVLLQGQNTATITSVEEKSGVYSVGLNVQGQSHTAYMTKSGDLFFLYGLETAAPLPTANAAAGTDATQAAAKEIPKTNKPEVDLYVMSFCPFGNKAEETMLPVYSLLKNDVDWKVHYIVAVQNDKVDSLHGQKEVDEDMREACVKRDYGLDTFWQFISYVNNNCGSDGSCWEAAAKQAKADPVKVKACVEKDGLALMTAEAQATSAAGARGSPTMFINGINSDAVYKYGDSESYKQAICTAFNTAPEACSTALGATASNLPAGSCPTN